MEGLPYPFGTLLIYVRFFSVTKNSNHGATWASAMVSDLVPDHPSISPNDIIQKIRRNHGVSFPYQTAWRANEEARNEIKGSDTKEYVILKFCLDKLEAETTSIYIKY